MDALKLNILQRFHGRGFQIPIYLPDLDFEGNVTAVLLTDLHKKARGIVVIRTTRTPLRASVHQGTHMMMFNHSFMSCLLGELGISRRLKFAIDVDINDVAVGEARQSTRYDTFAILKHEDYHGARHSRYNPRWYAPLSIDNGSSRATESFIEQLVGGRCAYTRACTRDFCQWRRVVSYVR